MQFCDSNQVTHVWYLYIPNAKANATTMLAHEYVIEREKKKKSKLSISQLSTGRTRALDSFGPKG